MQLFVSRQLLPAEPCATFCFQTNTPGRGLRKCLCPAKYPSHNRVHIRVSKQLLPAEACATICFRAAEHKCTILYSFVVVQGCEFEHMVQSIGDLPAPYIAIFGQSNKPVESYQHWKSQHEFRRGMMVLVLSFVHKVGHQKEIARPPLPYTALPRYLEIQNVVFPQAMCHICVKACGFAYL